MQRLSIIMIVLLVATLSISAQQDTDGDGVGDSTDLCPTVPGLPQNNGCPVFQIAPSPQPTDTDGDGLPDSRDLCPTVSGPVDNQGCPDTADQPTPPPVPPVEPTAIPTVRPLPVLPEDRCYVGTLGTTRVNIRPTASTDDTPIAVLDPYQPMVAVSIIDDWIQLESGGYVSASVVRMSNYCDDFLVTHDQSTPDDLIVVTDDGDDDYKCVYFRALFRNTGDRDHVLLIHLTDAIGEGSSSFIGPALVPEGETYYAEKHFLVPDNWEVPDHPSAGWNIIDDEFYGEFETDLYDFSLVDEVSFLITFREDCTSPQPVCYYTSLTVNNPTSETKSANFFMVYASDDVDLSNEQTHIVWFLEPAGGGYPSYNIPPGQTTHHFYFLSFWHYDEGEHLNLQLDAFAAFAQGLLPNEQSLQIVNTSDVATVPLDSIDHLCELNPVQVSGVSEGAADGFAPPPEDLACYYFEQDYANLTDDTLTSPEYQLVVYHRQSMLPAYDIFPETFSATIFSNGDKLQYLRMAPRYELEFGDTESELFIGYRQVSPADDGVVEAGPTLFMIVDDDYCQNDRMPFTHDALFEEEGITHACYHIQIAYANTTDSEAYITAQLLQIIQNEDGQTIIPYGDPNTKVWSASESGSRIFTIVAQPPDNGYLSYTLEGVDDLADPGSFWVTYNCPILQ